VCFDALCENELLVKLVENRSTAAARPELLLVCAMQLSSTCYASKLNRRGVVIAWRTLQSCL
jgi:hypothetical protein